MPRRTWEHKPELSGTLWAYHFPGSSVRVDWEDESFAEWNYAFWQREGEFIVVYTEHCGYHVLYLSMEEGEDGDRISGQMGPLALTKRQQAEYDAHYRRQAKNGK